MHGLSLSVARTSALLVLFTVGISVVPSQGTPLPGVGDSIVAIGISVTLLDAKRLTLDEYRNATGNSSPDWAGGGFRFAFLTENRPGAPMGPALGEVRIFIGTRPYNAVTNPTSRRPFAPHVIIRTVGDFFSTSYGRTVNQHGPAPRVSAVADVLDVFVRGDPVPDGSAVVVELEQGETYRPDGRGQLRQLSPAEMGSTWTPFRFAARRIR